MNSLTGRVRHQRRGHSDDRLAAEEGLRISSRRSRLDASYPHQGKKRLVCEPMAVLLRLESSRNESHFPATDRLIEVHKYVGRAQVAVVFRNFVLQDQMAPEGIPRQV